MVTEELYECDLVSDVLDSKIAILLITELFSLKSTDDICLLFKLKVYIIFSILLFMNQNFFEAFQTLKCKILWL